MRKKGSVKNCFGFTLSELAISSVVVGALVGIALPNFNLSGERTRSAEGVQIISAIWQTHQLYLLENNNSAATNINQLQVDLVAGGSFNAPVLNPVAGQTARIDRSNGHYSLYISNAGDLTCDDDPTGKAGICVKMGYIDYD